MLYKKLSATIIVLLSCVVYNTIKAQNLFVNSGFEDYNRCTEYNAECGVEGWFNIPPVPFKINNSAIPKPLFGKNQLWVNVENVNYPADRRAFVYTRFCCPLIKGQQYKLTFLLNTASLTFDHLDFFLSEKEPLSRGYNFMDITPTFTITGDNIQADVKQNWKLVEYDFVATADHKFCTLGNFSKEKMEFRAKQAMNKAGDVFYFLDDIQLKSMGSNIICNTCAATTEKIYAQNYRHSDNMIIEEELPPIVKKPVLISDTIVIPSVLFKVNSAVIEPAVKHILDSISNIIAIKKVSKIEINGHTDISGTAAKNEKLALARAENVKLYFSTRFPDWKERCFAFSKGQYFPIADNATAAGRNKNRRVEIVLTIFEMIEQ